MFRLDRTYHAHRCSFSSFYVLCLISCSILCRLSWIPVSFWLRVIMFYCIGCIGCVFKRSRMTKHCYTVFTRQSTPAKTVSLRSAPSSCSSKNWTWENAVITVGTKTSDEISYGGSHWITPREGVKWHRWGRKVAISEIFIVIDLYCPGHGEICDLGYYWH